ncbi:tetratricopeptide repeat protein [Pseudonocardia sp. CA-142604]|uniref:tetratricopeptide repeat protein n=1 Tax=Pseudonocardia sp. CA-142604 TaxID=3240024 RepID=UPI003D921D85
MAEHLRPAFVGDPLVDPDRAEVDVYLRAVRGSAAAAPLLLLWCGHGVQSGAKLWLQTRDEDGEVSVVEVIKRCVRSGANQLLFVLDTCFAGGGIPDAAEVAAALLEEIPPNAEHVWFGVLVSCAARDPEGAKDGAFGAVLMRLLERGPRSPDMQRRWSRHDRMIRGEDLGQALLEEWTEEDQRPDFLRRGSAWYMLPNPLWDEGAPEVVVEHLLLAARGGTDADDRSWFMGRQAEVDDVVSWATAAEPGIRVVTGSAGTGKSAIVGRVVSLSTPNERRRLLDGGPLPHCDPGVRSISAHVHARGLTADRAAELLDGQLVRAGMLRAHEHGRRKAAELIGALQRVADDRGQPPVLVVDGLDEARAEAFAIADDLLVRLAPYASVVVSTRKVRQDDPPRALVEELRPRAVLDLDDTASRESGRAALQDYVVARLTGVDEAMDPSIIAEHMVAGESSPVDQRPFLLARLVTDQLRAAPIDTSMAHWARHLAVSIETAFDVDLARVRPPGFGQPRDPATPDLSRQMLIALTWAFGGGFPEEEWLAVASQLAGHALGREHVSWVLDELGRYVVQDGEGGVAVYRVAHQSLADHLRLPYRRTGERPFDHGAEAVWEALATRYRTLLSVGFPATAPSYLWRYAYRHATAAGLPALDRLRELVDVADELRPDLAYAALGVADLAAAWGRSSDAVPPTEEAVNIYRDLAADNPAFLPNLAGALSNLGGRYSEVGRRADALPPIKEAVDIDRSLAAGNTAFLPDLAAALTNLGSRYGEVGRWADALPPTEEAVDIDRSLAAENPAFLPNLAAALSNLGIRYSEVGRRADALPPTEEAVNIYRDLAADNPASLPNLAAALTNLGGCYGEVGRWADALPPTEEAVNIYRDLAADNPASLPNLAAALSNLGGCYGEVGRRADALPPIEEAVNIYRDLAAGNPAFLPNLATALNNLGGRYSEVGRWADALPATEEAVNLYRSLAASNPAFLADLAGALTNLGGRYSEVGRRADALPPTEEAVDIDRSLAADNPAFLPNLAAALNNLGIRYSEVGRRADALPPTEEAVQLRRGLAADNPAFLPNLAGALNNLGGCYGEVGRWADALPPTEEAVNIYRDLAADNPAFLPNLAGALSNLGGRYSEVGRRADAQPPTEEAVNIYRDLAADNPAFLPNLAGALTNLGGCYGEVGRWADAQPPTEEAVNIYRDLAADNPAFLPNLAAALNTLARLCAEARDPDRADRAWEGVLADHGMEGQAVLLYFRATFVRQGDLRSVAWLVESCHTTDRGLLAAVRGEARRHRAGNPPAWDEVWSEATGKTPPGWLSIDPVLLAAAEGWVGTATYHDEQDHLAAHSELLDPVAEAAVEEALLPVAQLEADRYRQLIAEARIHGVDAAYRPLFLALLGRRFVAAPVAEQRALLNDRRADLLEDDVRDYVADHSSGDQTGATSRAVALLDLARAGDSALQAAFDALEDPDRFTPLLNEIAHDRPAVLEPLAALALSVASTSTAGATAAIYLGVAAALASDTDRATAAVRQAREWNPDSTQAWITTLASLGATHAAVLPLIPVLLEAPSDGEH